MASKSMIGIYQNTGAGTNTCSHNQAYRLECLDRKRLRIVEDLRFEEFWNGTCTKRRLVTWKSTFTCHVPVPSGKKADSYEKIMRHVIREWFPASGNIQRQRNILVFKVNYENETAELVVGILGAALDQHLTEPLANAGYQPARRQLQAVKTALSNDFPSETW